MASIEGGVSGLLQEVGLGAAVPAHVTAKALPHGSLGHYRVGLFTGILPAALAANSEIFQFRWVHATNLCVVKSVEISAAVSTLMFAAGVPVQLDLVRASAWSAQGTGGVGLAPAALLKARSNMGSSLIPSGDVRIATTAALGAGTKTLEGSALAAILAGGPITGSLDGTIFPPGTPLFRGDMADADHPLVLGVNEGFVVRSVDVPATGTWQAAIKISWAEVTLF